MLAKHTWNGRKHKRLVNICTFCLFIWIKGSQGLVITDCLTFVSYFGVFQMSAILKVFGQLNSSETRPEIHMGSLYYSECVSKIF